MGGESINKYPKRNIMKLKNSWQSLEKLHLIAGDHGKRHVKPFEEIPSPSGIYGLPYIGIALQFYPFTDLRTNRFDRKVKIWHEEFGDICRIRITAQEWLVFIFDPNDIEHVYRNDKRYPDFADLQLFKTYNKRRNKTPSVMDRNGKDWFDLRKPAQKQMGSPRAVAKYIPKLSAISDDFVELCRTTGKLENLPDPLTVLAMENIGMLCFNTRLGCLDNGFKGNQKLISAYKYYFKYLGKQLFTPVHWFKWFTTPGYIKFEKSADIIYSLLEENVDRHFRELNQGNESDITMTRDLLNFPGMTQETTVAILIDIFKAGVETAANTMMFLLYQLAKHPDKQEKVYQEVAERLKTGSLDENSLENLPYIKACLKESLRVVNPFVGGQSRVLDKDIEVNGYIVPAGVRMSLNTQITSSKDKYFRNPHLFEPERWLHGKGKEHHPFASLPFGFGARNCMGQRFAQQEIYINVAKILFNFHLSLPANAEEPSVTYATFVTVEKPFTINLEQRK